MDGAQALLECGGAHSGRGQHVRPRLEVPAVGNRARQVLLDQPRSLERHAVGVRMVRGHAVGLEIVRQRVHAGRRRDMRRQPESKLGIADDDARHHLGVEENLFGVRRLVGDDGGAADLGAGAGGGRHGDDGQDPIGIGAGPPIADVLEVPHRPRLAGHQGDDLAGIERAAAAKADHAVVAAGAKRLEPVMDILLDRVRPDVMEEGDA